MRKAILLLSLLAFAAAAQAQPVPSHAYSHADGSFDTINLDGLDGSGLTGISSGFSPSVQSTVQIPDSGDGNPGVYLEDTNYVNATVYTCEDGDGCELYLDNAGGLVDGQVFTMKFSTAGAGLPLFTVFNPGPVVWLGLDLATPVMPAEAIYNIVWNANTGLWIRYPGVFALTAGNIVPVIRNDGTTSANTYFAMDEFPAGNGSFVFNTENSVGGDDSANLQLSGGTSTLSGEIVNVTTDFTQMNLAQGATRDEWRIWGRDDADSNDQFYVRGFGNGNAAVEIIADVGVVDSRFVLQQSSASLAINSGDNAVTELSIGGSSTYIRPNLEYDILAPGSGGSVNLTSTVTTKIMTLQPQFDNTYGGGKVQTTVFCEDGTDEQIMTAEASVVWSREGGTTICTAAPTEIYKEEILTGASTLTCVWSGAVVSTNCEISLNCTTSLTPTTFVSKVGLHLNGYSGSTGLKVTIP